MADDWAWMSRTRVSALIGCGPTNFDQRIRPRLPKGAETGEGRTLRFHAPTVVETWHDYQTEIEKPAKPEADPSVKVEPAQRTPLDEGRELDNLQKRVSLMRELDLIVDKSFVRPALLAYARPIGNAIAELDKNHGTDAGDIVREAIQISERDALRTLGGDAEERREPDQRDGISEPPATTPNDR